MYAVKKKGISALIFSIMIILSLVIGFSTSMITAYADTPGDCPGSFDSSTGRCITTGGFYYPLEHRDPVGFQAKTDIFFVERLRAFLYEYRLIMNILTGIIVLTNIGIFVYHFCRLGFVSSNPQARSQCITDILITAVCLALTGSGAIVFYILFRTVN